MKKFAITSLLLLFFALAAQATTRRVLFIGNSYTYTNNMPLMLQSFATAMGDTLIYDESDPGGYTLEQHSTYAPTLAKITSQQWDIVILQEQSQRPAFPPSQVETEVYPYAHILDSIIHANDACTQTMFMMTWGHANGDPSNCGVYPDICTYDGMQQRLRESYMQMTQDNNAIVAPVGAAWKMVRDSFPSLWLYQPDSVHPSLSGSYLQTCVLYSSIFHRPSSDCPYTANLPATDVQRMQRIADRVVVDSLSQWQQYGHYPSAAFSMLQSATIFTFTSQPIVSAATEHWDFGDGNTADTSSPVHNYPVDHVYTVTHTVSTNCFSESQTATLTTERTGVPLVTKDSRITVFSSGNNKVIFHFAATASCKWLRIYDMNGRCIRTYLPSNGDDISDNFAPGLYIFKACFSSDTVYSCKQFSVF